MVFLSNFFRIVLHYTFRAFFLFVHWCHVTFGAREGHRASVDLPEIPNSSPFHVSVQEPFQYVDRNRQNETEVTDDSLHCNFNSSIDTCHINDDEGDTLVDALT